MRMAGYKTRSDTTKMRRLINALKVRWSMVIGDAIGDDDVSIGDGD